MNASVAIWRHQDEDAMPVELQKTTGLVISSQQISRSIMVEQMRQMGIATVHQSTRWREARGKLEARQYDVVICDHDLGNPKETGLALIDDLRRAGRLHFTTIFMLVADVANYSEVAEAAESGVDGYILRPFSLGEITDRVIRCRRRRIEMADIYDRVDSGDLEGALKLSAEYYKAKRTYWLYAARITAELLIQLSRPLEAMVIYQDILATQALPWARIGIARVHMQSGDQAAAISTLNELLSDDPQQTDAYDLLGRAHLELGQENEAVQSYKMAADSTPSSVTRLQRYGFALMFCNDTSRGVDVLTRAMRIGQESKMFDPQALVLLAGHHFANRDARALEEVSGVMNRVREKDPESPRIERFWMAVEALSAIQAGFKEEALRLARSLHEQSQTPEFDFEAACNLAMLLSVMREREVTFNTADTCIEELGERFSSSRLTSTWLSRAARGCTLYSDNLQGGFDRLFERCQAAIKIAIKGEHEKGLSTLIALAQATRNIRAIEMAEGAVERYSPQLANAASYRASIAELRSKWGAKSNKKVPGDHGLRHPGGISLRAGKRSQE